MSEPLHSLEPSKVPQLDLIGNNDPVHAEPSANVSPTQPEPAVMPAASKTRAEKARSEATRAVMRDKKDDSASVWKTTTHEQAKQLIADFSGLPGSPKNEVKDYLVNGGREDLKAKGLTDEDVIQVLKERLGDYNFQPFLNEVDKEIRLQKRARKRAENHSTRESKGKPRQQEID